MIAISMEAHGSLTRRKDNPFLVSFLNLHSYLLVLPFRVKYSKDGYFATSSKIRKVVCFLLHVCILLAAFLWTYQTIKVFIFAKQKVSLMFLVVCQVSVSVATFLALKIFWLNRNDLVELCNLTSSKRIPSKPRRIQVSKYLACLLHLLVMIVHVCQGVFSYHRAKTALMSYNLLKSITMPLFDFLGFNPFDWPAAIFDLTPSIYMGLFLNAFFCTFANLPVTIFLTLALTMRHMVITGVETCSKVHCKQIILEYQKLKRATDKLRDIFSSFIISYYVMSLSFFSHLPKMILVVRPDSFDNIFLYGYISLIAASLYTAMSPNVKAYAAMRYSMRNYEIKPRTCGNQHFLNKMRQLRIIALNQDLRASELGISCSIFTINRSFLRSTIGIVTTYIIVVLQSS